MHHLAMFILALEHSRVTVDIYHCPQYISNDMSG